MSRDFIVFWIVCLVGAGLFFVAMPALHSETGSLAFAVKVLKYTSLGGVGLVFLRIRSIFRLFREGAEVQGVVRGRKYFNHGQRVSCEYVFNGRPYSMLIDPGVNEPIPGVDGQSVVYVLLDPRNPNNAVVRDMFASSPRNGAA